MYEILVKRQLQGLIPGYVANIALYVVTPLKIEDHLIATSVAEQHINLGRELNFLTFISACLIPFDTASVIFTALDGESVMLDYLAKPCQTLLHLIVYLVIIGLIFSCFSVGWVDVENDLAAFLPDEAESNLGLKIMEDQFVTYGTAQIMVANVSLEKARQLLTETDLPIQDVSVSCGYTSINSFYKAFQRTFAIAPNAMRKNAQEENEK